MKMIPFILILLLPFLTMAQSQYAYSRYGSDNNIEEKKSNASWTNEPDLTYNIAYNGKFTDEQDLEATALLYKEINYYRKVNGIAPLTISKTIVGYACRWGNYMVSRHVSPYDNFYEHSTYGPDSLHIPHATCSEIIHLIYYGHKPSAVEIVSGLMYGIVRNPQSVIGWTQSEDHNFSLLQNIVIYYGASIYVFKTTNNWWAVFGTVNFSTVK